MVNNLNDGMVWGLIPVFLAARGLALDRIGMVTAIYPWCGEWASLPPAR